MESMSMDDQVLDVGQVDLVGSDSGEQDNASQNSETAVIYGTEAEGFTFDGDAEHEAVRVRRGDEQSGAAEESGQALDPDLADDNASDDLSEGELVGGGIWSTHQTRI